MRRIIPWLLLSASLLAQAETPELFEVKTQLTVDKKPLKTETFTIQSNESRFEIFEDENGKAYKVFYYVFPGEQKDTIEIQTHVSTIVIKSDFLVPDNEQASFIIKPEMPELEIMVKATRIDPAKKDVAHTSGQQAK